MAKIIKNITRKGHEFEQIMGINLLSSSTASVLTRVKDLLSHNSKFYIVTPNPELVLMAQKNLQLRNALNSADLPIPDGVGLNYAFKYVYGRRLNIIPGRVLFKNLIELAEKNRWKVFLLGGMENEAELAVNELLKKHKNLKIKSAKGPRLDKNAEPVTEVGRKLYTDTVKRINNFKPDILFVAFGNPKQEVWIYKNLNKLNIGGAMAVGGTLRYISGYAKLPPKWMEVIGFEWAWRLIIEPYRLTRVFNAVVVFPMKVLLTKKEVA